jgi:NADH:ubiquinone oxidoreductase subunit 2 (subunit N)
MLNYLVMPVDFAQVISIYYFSVVSYVLIFMNFFFILFNFNVFKLASIQFFNLCSYCDFYFFSTIIILLSLAGIPPFFGFASKLLYLLLFLQSFKVFFFVIFCAFNFFCIYFYIFNVRYLLIKKPNAFLYLRHFRVTYNFKLHVYIISLNLLNVFGIFFVEFFLNFFNYVASFYFLV